MLDQLTTDILIIGAGGASLFAALHAKRAAPELELAAAVKGLLGTAGGTPRRYAAACTHSAPVVSCACRVACSLKELTWGACSALP